MEGETRGKKESGHKQKQARKPKARPGARFFRVLSFLVGFALFVCALGFGVIVFLNSPPKEQVYRGGGDSGIRIEGNTTVFLEVRAGESAFSVGRRLKDAGIIKSSLFWYLLCRYNADFIKTGSYQLTVPAAQIDIHATLVEGRQMLYRVTIPEGVTLKKMARIFEDAGICRADAFLAKAEDPGLIAAYRIPGPTMEGYLYPDTYLFPLDYPADLVVKSMADTFYARLGEIDADAVNLGPDELNEKVILASIVEREYRVDEEAPLMAGVFYNRLDIGMALQSCATVEYVITEIQGKPHPEVLYTRDTEIRNPYNTYIRPGLPPGPISAPGKAALNAGFHPVPSDYLYFRLVDPEAGRHYFSKTFDDHIRAGAFYVKRSGG
jgi:UPF0755 protein